MTKFFWIVQYFFLYVCDTLYFLILIVLMSHIKAWLHPSKLHLVLTVQNGLWVHAVNDQWRLLN